MVQTIVNHPWLGNGRMVEKPPTKMVMTRDGANDNQIWQPHKIDMATRLSCGMFLVFDIKYGSIIYIYIYNHIYKYMLS